MSDNFKLDKWDYTVSLSCGALTAIADALFVKDISLVDAHKWGVKKSEKFVKDVAHKYCGYNGDNTTAAIKKLEESFSIPADKATNDFGGGSQHHLRDFTHHPTVAGLVFSIITQFTGNVYGSDTDGSFKVVQLEGWQRKGFLESVSAGTVDWAMHLISDMAGSSSSVAKNGNGTGIPGPILATLKELSSIPGIRKIAGKDARGNYNFSVFCSKLFNGTLLGEHENGKIVKGEELKIDLRTELGLANEIRDKKQHFPVLICEGITYAFYFLRRCYEYYTYGNISSLEDIKRLHVREILPENDNRLKHMRLLSSAAFSLIDISAAGIRAAVECKGDRMIFAKGFLQGINYFGVGRLAIALTGEAGIAIGKLYENFTSLTKHQTERALASAKVEPEMVEKIISQAFKISSIGTPVGFVAVTIGVYDEINSALSELELAREERIRIEEKCRINVQILKENRQEMESMVSAYMTENLTVFTTSLDAMEKAMLDNDSDKFISENNEIQKQLNRQNEFFDQSGFDELMNSDNNLKL